MTGIKFFFKNKIFGYVKGFYFHSTFIRQYYCVAKRQLSDTVFGNNWCVYFSLEDVLAENCLILSRWKNL